MSPILHTLSKPISGVCHDSCQHSRRYVGNFFLDVGLQILQGSWTVYINKGFQKTPQKKNHKGSNRESGLATPNHPFIDPWFFEQNQVTMTVNSDRYVNMSQELFFPQLDQLVLGGIWTGDGDLVPTRRCNGTDFKNIDGCFEGTLPRAPHLNQGCFGVAGPLSEFDPLSFFSMLFLEIPCLCKPSKNPTRFEDQHPGRNCQHSACYAGGTHDRHQKSVYAVYGECNLHTHQPDVIFETN